MAWDLVSIAAHSIAVITGLVTLHRHNSFFRQFVPMHLWQMRMDALLYVLTLQSTTTSLLLAFIRGLWLAEVGWETVGLKWKVILLFGHIAISSVMICLHLVTNRLLNNRSICQLCLRPREQHA